MYILQENVIYIGEVFASGNVSIPIGETTNVTAKYYKVRLSKEGEIEVLENENPGADVFIGIALIGIVLLTLFLFGALKKSYLRTLGLFIGSLMVVYPINYIFLGGRIAHPSILLFHIFTYVAVTITNFFQFYYPEDPRNHKTHKFALAFALIFSLFHEFFMFCTNFPLLLFCFFALVTFTDIFLIIQNIYKKNDHTLLTVAFLIPCAIYFDMLIISWVPHKNVQFIMDALNALVPFLFPVMAVMFRDLRKEARETILHYFVWIWVEEQLKKDDVIVFY